MCCIHPKTKINFETDKVYFYKAYIPLPEVKDIYIGITTDTEKLMKDINNLVMWTGMVPRQVTKVWDEMLEIKNKHGFGWKVKIIGVFEFKNLDEAIEQQHKYVKEFGATLNALEQEDRQTHDRQRAKQYRQEHKEQINERERKRYNKEQNHQKYLKYKESHREQIRERGTTKCVCECGKEYNRWSKSSHQKTIFHQNWLKENNNNN